MVTGSLNNAKVFVLGGSPVCIEGGVFGKGPEKLWLPPTGADGYEYLTSGGFGWSVGSAANDLPQSLICGQTVDLDGVRISSTEPVDMSYSGIPPTPLSPYIGRNLANGQGRLDAMAVDRALSSPRSGIASFKIDCGEVGSASWTTPYTVLPASPPGREPGVSINDGADFTNDPDVRLFLAWRAWGWDKVKVSNDGGFAPSKTRVFELTSGDPIPWRLVVLGNERLPKTVYVRLHSPSQGGGWQTETFTDDIVLDTVVPQILALSFAPPGDLLAARRAVRVRAKDNRSGIKAVQVSKGKPRKKTKVQKFRRTLAAPGSGRVFVRVRDGAGNWSKWREVV
jgi:hypothetical protein